MSGHLIDQRLERRGYCRWGAKGSGGAQGAHKLRHHGLRLLLLRLHLLELVLPVGRSRPRSRVARLQPFFLTGRPAAGPAPGPLGWRWRCCGTTMFSF